MSLNISNEFSTLRSVVVCWGDNIPEYGKYKTNDPEFTKFHPFAWNKQLLLKQQEKFFKVLKKYKVKLIFPKTKPVLPQQMFTRDTGFVIGNKLFYSGKRKFKVRNGEIEELLNVLQLPKEDVININAYVEGGDVLVEGVNSAFIGQSSRTGVDSIREMSNHFKVKALEMTDMVMHLDTRLTLLPNNLALINSSAFTKNHLQSLAIKYKLLEVSPEETKRLGTNVFVINPETICVPSEHSRIINMLSKDFKVEVLDYSEPINLSGSFRCTTLPLKRAD